MIRTISVLPLLFVASFLFGQRQFNFNLDSISSFNYPETKNDVWGFVDRNGVEYAVLGTVDATAVISLEDPSNPQEVIYVPGQNTIWRDMKSQGEYIYSVCDQCNDGLLIIDMTTPEAPGSRFQKTFFDSTIMDSTSLGSFHNIYVDERGYLYGSGGDLNNGGIVVFDVSTDPSSPVIIGYGPAIYSHDIYARHNILHASEIFEGELAVYDVSDPNGFVLLGRQMTSGEFTHNAWLSDDANTVFTTDEIARGYVDAYDVSDPNDIRLLDRYRPQATIDLDVIPHNVHVLNDFLIISYYTDGVKVVDAEQPHNLIEVGSFDTWFGQDEGFNGNWGAYPFLPSGLVLASDRESGLHVLSPTYKRGSYLEGLVTDLLTGQPIPGVEVLTQSVSPNMDLTNNSGRYATGGVGEDSLVVRFSHPLYQDTTVEVPVEEGVVTELDIALFPLGEGVNLQIDVVDVLGRPVAQADMLIIGDIQSGVRFTADEFGRFTDQVINEEVTLYVYRWGYGDTTLTIDDLSVPITIQLPEDGLAYADDFSFDLGWSSSAIGGGGGNWERGVPSGSSSSDGLSFSPEEDSPSDSNDECYTTGLAPDEVFGRLVRRLQTPWMTLLDTPVVNLSFDYWMMTDFPVATPTDLELTVDIVSDEGDIQEVDLLNDRSPSWNRFGQVNLRPFLDDLDATAEYRIVFRVFNRGLFEGAFNNAEVAIDHFLISYTDAPVSSEEVTPSDAVATIYPNPSDGRIVVKSEQQVSRILIMDTSGRLVGDLDEVSETHVRLELPMSPGLYILQISYLDGSAEVHKVIRR